MDDFKQLPGAGLGFGVGGGSIISFWKACAVPLQNTLASGSHFNLGPIEIYPPYR